jgi:DnaJ-class molecular chaperone
MELRNFYEHLGVDQDATIEEIKRAYRKLAREHHPDVVRSEDEVERFYQIQQAYETLSDPTAREKYDADFIGFRKREEQVNEYQRQQESTKPHSRSSKDEDQERRWRTLQSFNAEATSTFENKSASESIAKPAGKVFHKLKKKIKSVITADDPVEEQISQPENTANNHSQESQSKRERDAFERPRFYQFTITASESLSGTSREIALPGEDGPRVIRVKIPKAIQDNATLRVNIEGGGRNTQHVLEIRVRIENDDLVERRGNDVLLKVPITLLEAMTGAEIDIPALDGQIRIKIPLPWTPASEITLENRGIREPGSRNPGKLTIRTFVVLPETVNENSLKAARLIEELYLGAVRRTLPKNLGEKE